MDKKDLLKYDVKELKRQGKIDCKFPRPGSWVTVINSFHSLVFEVLKIRKDGHIIIYDSCSGQTLKHLISELHVLNSEDVAGFQREQEKKAFRGYFLNSPMKKLGYLRKFLEKILPRIYTEDRYEIRFNNDFDKLFFTIHYPSITIRNSTGQEHEIKDLFVKLIFRANDSAVYLSDIHYARTTFSEKDILVREGENQFYIHSHLNHTSPGTWSGNFCYGGGTLLGRAFGEFSSYVDLAKISTFLINLEDTLKWESLEGGPYRRLSSLGQNLGGVSDYDYTKEEETFVFTYLLNRLKKSNSFPSFNIVEGETPSINYKHRLHEMISEGHIQYHKIKGFPPSLFLFDEETSQSITNTEGTISNIEKNFGIHSRLYIPFKGEKVHPKFVIEGNYEESSEKMKLCHITLYDSIVAELEQKLKMYIIIKVLKNE